MTFAVISLQFAVIILQFAVIDLQFAVIDLQIAVNHIQQSIELITTSKIVEQHQGSWISIPTLQIKISDNDDHAFSHEKFWVEIFITADINFQKFNQWFVALSSSFLFCVSFNKYMYHSRVEVLLESHEVF